MDDPRLTLRPAASADQPRITQLIREARLYPLGLNWERFWVAEQGGEITGAGQIKTHRRGARELASIVVAPSGRGEGIASKIIDALLAQEPGPVYLTCNYPLEAFYERFGFRRISGKEMPPDFRHIALFLALLNPIGNLITRGKFRVFIMKRN